MKVAIVHDYLTQKGGAERVVGVLHQMFPNAPIYTSVLNREQMWDDLKNADIRKTWMQYIPGIKKHFKLFFWLYPFGFRSMCLKNYDVVISSSSAYAKGVRLKSDANGRRPVHICYCHTPMRFSWDFDRYISKESNSKILTYVARMIIPLLKRWDLKVNDKVDVFIANSRAVQERIYRIYQRESAVIYPPVNTEKFENVDNELISIVPRTYFLVVSRLVSYKRIDLAIKACSEIGQLLIVIGEGPDRKRLETIAGSCIRFLGWQSEEITLSYMAKCKAFIFPGEEDFGITPVEVNAVGRPVIAYRAGGALDTVVEGLSGIFFDEQTVNSLIGALKKVESVNWISQDIREHAEKFNQRVFESAIRNLIQNYNSSFVCHDDSVIW